MKFSILASAAMLVSAPALAQEDHSGHGAPPAAPEPVPEDPHAGHDMSAAGNDEAAAGNAVAPAPPTDHAADAIYGADRMSAARKLLSRETGRFRGSLIQFDLAEYQARQGGDGFRWDAAAWYGGDINKVLIRSEGEGVVGHPIEDAELALLYSRAVAPYWDLHLGLRHDIVPNPSRTFAVLGIAGTAPYWLHVSGQVFLSHKGEVSARIEGSYDQRLTQRLILAPRVELNLAAQDVPVLGIGAGLSDVELGLRLRYEIARKFAPYLGLEWVQKVGDTARFARAAGKDPDVTNFIAGIRFWF